MSTVTAVVLSPSNSNKRTERNTVMKIIKATDAIPVDHPVFLIYGQPGICKSSLGYSAKDPLTLDFDRGAHRAANRRDTLLINAWPDASDLASHVEALAPYSTIVTDTVGRCLDMIIANLAITEPKKCPGGNPTQQGWGTVKTSFRNWMNTLRSLGKDPVLIAHDKEDKDGETRIVRPDIVGGSYAEVFKIADFVGYVYMSGKQRILDFNPTDRWIGKNPAQWQPFEVPPVGKATDFLARLIDDGRAALGNISEASAAITRLVDGWRGKIQAFRTVDAFNRDIPEIKQLPMVVQQQVAKILMDEADRQGIPFDKEKRVFVMPQPQPQAQQQAPSAEPVTAGSLL